MKLRHLLGINIGDVVGECQKCGGNLVVKQGRFGKFIGCSNFYEKGCKCAYSYEHFDIRNSDECSENVKLAIKELGRKLLL